MKAADAKPSIIHRLFCKLGRCLQCTHYETPDGCGGICIHCGKIHGWVTRGELRRYCDDELRKLGVAGRGKGVAGD